jgi:glutamate formiminotransferase / 5-formyltetrahydrofolate cyclo-ligase
MPLLAVPNVSEGRNASTITAIGDAFSSVGAVRLLDVHSDSDHHRSVFTLAGGPGELAAALLAGARVAVERIDISSRAPEEAGGHPHVGALDIAPVVHLTPAARGSACAEALVAADMIGEDLHIPIFLYGALAQGRSRAELRRGGAKALEERIRSRDQDPDFGPPRLHPTAGATLVAARAPLVAFNVELGDGASLQDAAAIAALIREGGEEGLEGVRAIAVHLSAGRGPQVSMNVERPEQVPLRAVVQAVGRHAPIALAELVGLAPRAALEGFPPEVPLPGFDPRRQLIENALGF